MNFLVNKCWKTNIDNICWSDIGHHVLSCCGVPRNSGMKLHRPISLFGGAKICSLHNVYELLIAQSLTDIPKILTQWCWNTRRWNRRWCSARWESIWCHWRGYVLGLRRSSHRRWSSDQTWGWRIHQHGSRRAVANKLVHVHVQNGVQNLSK